MKKAENRGGVKQNTTLFVTLCADHFLAHLQMPAPICGLLGHCSCGTFSTLPKDRAVWVIADADRMLASLILDLGDQLNRTRKSDRGNRGMHSGRAGERLEVGMRDKWFPPEYLSFFFLRGPDLGQCQPLTWVLSYSLYLELQPSGNRFGTVPKRLQDAGRLRSGSGTILKRFWDSSKNGSRTVSGPNNRGHDPPHWSARHECDSSLT